MSKSWVKYFLLLWIVAFTVVCSNISKIINMNVKYAQKFGDKLILTVSESIRKDLESLIHEADKMMYENKRHFHETE